MPRRPSYDVVYDEEVTDHLAAIERKYYTSIRRTIEQQLRHEPEVETVNRKPLLRPSAFGTAWELRLGPDNRFRVFYRVEASGQVVRVLAIGVKVGSRLQVGRERFDL